MKRLALGALALLAFTACAGTTPRVAVERRGFSVRGPDGLGVAALVRVSGDRALDRIPIEVRLYARDREVLVERSTLPFCPPDTDCWFAESYTSPDVRDADRLVVEAGVGTPTEQRRRIVEVRTGTSPNDGTVSSVVTTADGRPVWGRSVQMRRGETIAPPDTVERDERLLSFLYVGASVDAGRPGAD